MSDALYMRGRSQLYEMQEGANLEVQGHGYRSAHIVYAYVRNTMFVNAYRSRDPIEVFRLALKGLRPVHLVRTQRHVTTSASQESPY